MPQDALGLPEIIRRTMNQYNDNIMDRMDSVRRGRLYTKLDSSRYLLANADNTIAAPSKTNEWNPFVKGFGIWGNRDSECDIAGYGYSVYGVVAGMDKLFSDKMLFGFGIGGSTANVDYSFSNTDADIDSLLLSLYGSYFKNDWHIDWTAGYSHNWYDSKRGIHFGAIDRQAESDHQGNAYSAAIEFGKNLAAPSATIFEPVAGFGYTLVQEDGYTEKGADALNLKVDSDTTDGFYSKLGIRMAKEFRTEKLPDVVIVPKVNMFWIHDFAERVEVSSSFVGGGSFATKGHDPERDLFNAGAALNIYLNKNKRFFVDYVWQASSDFSSSMLQAGVQWSF
jgi:outer membrane autotransporter protein